MSLSRVWVDSYPFYAVKRVWIDPKQRRVWINNPWPQSNNWMLFNIFHILRPSTWSVFKYYVQIAFTNCYLVHSLDSYYSVSASNTRRRSSSSHQTRFHLSILFEYETSKRKKNRLETQLYIQWVYKPHLKTWNIMGFFYLDSNENFGKVTYFWRYFLHL